jgi:hypothetical protein
VNKSTNQSRKDLGYKRWVFLFVLLALSLHAAVFYLFTLDLQEAPAREVPTSFVVFQSEDVPRYTDELEQRAYLFDSEPLFLPTSRNYSGPIKTDVSVWEPEMALSASYDPDIRWDDSLLMMETKIGVDLNSPLQLLKTVPRDFVSEFGSDKEESPKPKKAGLFVEAKTDQGEQVLKTFIELKEALEIDFPLNPVEFSIFSTHFGLAGQPLLINPSGNEKTDNFIREFILQNVHPILLGTTGYLHVRIGL